MLSNSEFIIMLNQSSTDRDALAELFKMSETEKSYITNVLSGEGLLRKENLKIPFRNVFPKDKELYKLMTTKLSEINK